MISSIKDLKESLSDFNSCISSSSPDDSVDESKVTKKQKRKRRATPDKQLNLKKTDRKVSPPKVVLNKIN